MTYNGLKLSGDDGVRQPAFQQVFEAARPDILLMQEIVNEAGADLILDALNASGLAYERAPFIDGRDTDNALFYRTSTVAFIAQDTIGTSLREFSEYRVRIGDNEVLLYSAHLKASDSPNSQNQRFDEASILRDHLNRLTAGAEFILVGDMNLYGSSEPAYQKLIADEADNDGRLEDLLPDSLIGAWHSNPAFAGIHTQSTRASQFGGGSSGGVDDRFDFIFGSFGLNDSTRIEYLEGSYTAFGNDGRHFNASIDEGVNQAVSAAVAAALYQASDHLPVLADFVSLDTQPPAPAIVFCEIFYDTPGVDADEEWIELCNTSQNLVDISGWSIVDNNGAGSAFVLPEGLSIAPESSLALARHAGAFFQLYGYDADVYGALPALNNDGDALVLWDRFHVEIDRAAWEGGAGAGLPEEWGSITEPVAARGQSLVRIEPNLDSNTFADWTIALNNGRPETQGATLFQAGISNVGTEDDSLLPSFRLDQNFPNPFRSTTNIRYFVADPTHVTVAIYDVVGREIERLVDGVEASGSHEVVYSAESLPSGIYLYRVQAGAYIETRRFVVSK